MKKLDFIHLIVITAAIFLCYSAISLLPNLFSYLLFWITNGLNGGGPFEELIWLFISFSVYIILAAIVLKNSKSWSNYIAHKYDVHDAGVINTSKHDLLYIMFIGLGIYNLLQRLPTLVKDIYKKFSQEVSRGILELREPRQTDIAPQIISVLLSIFMIVYAKYLADQFASPPHHDDATDTSEETHL